MRAYYDTLRVIVLIALRNLSASRVKTLIVGGIILFGAATVVVGTSLVDSVGASMRRSIVGSVAGDIQVYNAKSRDDLLVMGDFGAQADVEQIDDFKKLRALLLGIPNVKAVVPMGLSNAMVMSGNTVDRVLENMRGLVRRQQAGENVKPAIESQKAHVRQIVSVLSADMVNMRRILSDKAVALDEQAAVRRASGPNFWNEFDQNPFATLEFLENRIAPIASDSEMLLVRYMGTDLAAFGQSFDRLKIVDGTLIPQGRRGFLFSKWIYEREVKLKTALVLDDIREAILKRGRTIATDSELQRWVKQNSKQVKEILLQLDGQQTDAFRTKLQRELSSKTEDVAALLSEFLRVDDGNFMRRYHFFYDELAPALTLYRVRVGDTLTVKAFTKGGYVQSVNLRVYGTFAFEGLEDSNLAGALNLMDMVSFRELYGFSTPEREQEIQAIRNAAGVKEVDRDDAEVELFGTKAGATEPALEAGAAMVSADEVLRGLGNEQEREKREEQAYDPAQLGEGVVMNAAVILKDPRQIPQTIGDIEAAGTRAGLTLKAVDWQKAAGLVGQFVTMIRAVLYVSVLIIFAVALVIINNALVMATLERIAEIGTLRAVGAQRRFLFGMLLVETLAVGALFGGIGSALGASIIALLRTVGIPASNDIMHFLFSGQRLQPALSPTNLCLSLAIVLLVSCASSIYPCLVAMRVNPRQAMQSDE